MGMAHLKKNEVCFRHIKIIPIPLKQENYHYLSKALTFKTLIIPWHMMCMGHKYTP